MNKLIITDYKEKITTIEYCGQTAVDINLEKKSDFHLYDVFVGRVESIAKNINSAFISIGDGVKCFYQLDAEDKIKTGDVLPVQIVKEKSKSKDAECSINISIPGEFVVVTEGLYSLGISSKFTDNNRKFDLQQLFDSTFSYDDNYSFILRTKSEKATDEEILGEAYSHMKLIEELKSRAAHTPEHKKIFSGTAYYIDKIRDMKEACEIVTDDKAVYENVLSSFPDANVTFYEDELLPLSKLYKTETLIKEASGRKVWLKCGGYIVIDETEAMTVIDVNTGKNDSKKNMEETFFVTNLEAAREAARQIRLRNLSGIIIIDFIDMKKKSHMDEVVEFLKEAVFSDPVRTIVVDVTKLNLVELTRKKMHMTLKEQLSASV